MRAGAGHAKHKRRPGVRAGRGRLRSGRAGTAAGAGGQRQSRPPRRGEHAHKARRRDRRPRSTKNPPRTRPGLKGAASVRHTGSGGGNTWSVRHEHSGANQVKSRYIYFSPQELAYANSNKYPLISRSRACAWFAERQGRSARGCR